MGYVRANDSTWRTFLSTQYQPEVIEGGNAWGTVLWEAEDGEIIPVICCHGGSMWLCRGCADQLLKEKA